MAFRLPPLNTLRLFEAAGRRLSFKLAAEELNLTPSAVSHGIQTLEDWLGTPLFHRGVRGLSLTTAGERYLPQIAQALALVAHATQSVPGRKPTGELFMSVAPTFAARWLIPRLSRFRERHPELLVTVDTARRHVEFPLDGVDLAIRMSQGPKSTGDWIPLVREELVPVCSPTLLESFGSGSVEATLAKACLIHVTTVTEDWEAWFRALGYEFPLRGKAIRVDTIQLAEEAAVQGLGVALGRKPLVDQELESGRLVTLSIPPIKGETGYWLVGADGAFERPEVKHFRNWILKELDAINPSLGAARPMLAVT